jgi:glyoxylase-like metal-dependent hydrolase (beta-lactamase superfamily II)
MPARVLMLDWPLQVHDRVWAIPAPFGSGSLAILYVITGDELTLIDTGVLSSPIRSVGPGLRALGFDLRDIKYVLNTHGHHDHLGGNPAIVRESPRASILLHALDRMFADSLDHHLEFATEHLRHFGQAHLASGYGDYFAEMLGSTSAGVDRTIDEGDVIDLGGDLVLRVLHTPGHTPGSVCFYWESEGVLFSGDAIQGRGSPAGAWPLYVDASAYRTSLDRLSRLQVGTLALGHGFQSGLPLNWPVKRGSEVDAFFQESLEVTQAIADAIQRAIDPAGHSSSLEVAILAVQRLLGRIPTRIESDTLLPESAATLWAHIREARR